VYTRASPMDILARKTARRTKVRRQVGELNGPRNGRACRDRPTAARAGHADFRARILARKSARKSVSVSVSVSVPWSLSYTRRDHSDCSNFRWRLRLDSVRVAMPVYIFGAKTIGG